MPVDFRRQKREHRRWDRFLAILSPLRGSLPGDTGPQAGARGFIMPPLRGSNSTPLEEGRPHQHVWRGRAVRYAGHEIQACIPLLQRILLQQLPRNNQPLQLIRASADHQKRRIPVKPLDRKILRKTIAAHDPHGFQRNLGCRFRRK